MRAAIFDMDGLLIDSEPLWQDAEIAVFGEISTGKSAMINALVGQAVADAMSFNIEQGQDFDFSVDEWLEWSKGVSLREARARAKDVGKPATKRFSEKEFTMAW